MKEPRPGRGGETIKRAALVLVVAPAIAHADERTVRETREANLENDERHQNKNLTFGIGGGLTVGMGIDDAVGNGGSVTLRLAQMSTKRMAFTLEGTTIVLRHSVKTTADMSDVKENVDTNLLIGVQFYVNRSLWLRTATGIGAFVAKGIEGDGGIKRDVTLAGPAALIGAGVDMIRLKRVSFGLEMIGIGMVNREGLLSSGGLLVNVCVE